jgi:hypothetical protein
MGKRRSNAPDGPATKRPAPVSRPSSMGAEGLAKKCMEDAASLVMEQGMTERQYIEGKTDLYKEAYTYFTTSQFAWTTVNRKGAREACLSAIKLIISFIDFDFDEVDAWRFRLKYMHDCGALNRCFACKGAYEIDCKAIMVFIRDHVSYDLGCDNMILFLKSLTRATKDPYLYFITHFGAGSPVERIWGEFFNDVGANMFGPRNAIECMRALAMAKTRAAAMSAMKNVYISTVYKNRMNRALDLRYGVSNDE